ncbi:uncharacterized protein RHOBADRAFT_52140 [Rhodotorula graminis WP1]|uniref:Uncharacterized protein n=1 Tax=Rhodotorula graminis (strain WP1) TaxID=578459 RepID=A0A194S9D6_RHOGW|nr:uncharacterized protein RHOBADRAFT_52140 [Rhodotorula graminis WP1]KPV77199.1 hypothetical protein RHOBADRAFT_52140 [Rhodotorula graminis WP1]
MTNSHGDADSPVEPVDWYKAEAAACEAENELLRCEILQVEEQLERLPEEPEESNDALKRVTALEFELASVEASLSVLRSSKTSSPTSELRMNEQARLEVVNTVDELEKTIAWETQRKEDEVDALDMDKIYLQDATTLYATLAARASTANDTFSPRAAGDILVLRTQGLVRHLSRRTEALQRALVEFVDQLALGGPAAPAAEALEEGEGGAADSSSEREGEIPTSTSSSSFDLGEWIRADPAMRILGTAKAVTSGASDGAPAPDEPERQPETRAFQVKKLLEVLLNRSVLVPSDPWLDTSPSLSAAPGPDSGSTRDDGTGSYPPELVAFLVRAGIAVQHPIERAKVRLEDFAGLGGGGGS